jgi:Na+:H+ antiporter, NhaA family
VKKSIVDSWIINPVNKFISNSKMSGIVLFCSAFVALILANSPWSENVHHFWELNFSIGFNGNYIDKSIHHWINDCLMAVFFFVIGLELKREILVGELKQPKNALLPIVAAIAGMFFPALIYLVFNYSNSPHGWGIPMATDIAFALGILYLLGDKIPTSLKILLTAIAIVDDLGAVLVIAFFYTSNIDYVSLLTGVALLFVLISANLAGVRNTLFYGIIGIGGVWLAFLMSGVHATIAAVLAAFTIPANTNIDENLFKSKLKFLFGKYEEAVPNNNRLVTAEQQIVLEKIQYTAKNAIPPLQRLEHSLHPFVSFIIMPIFALSNAGVTIESGFMETLFSPITLGVVFGLMIGKVLGISGIIFFLIRLRITELPNGVNMKQIVGLSFLAAIGFTMSLFIAGLAFIEVEQVNQAKVGVLFSSIIASLIGYFILNRNSK